MVFARTRPEYKEKHCFFNASERDRRGPVGDVRLARAEEYILCASHKPPRCSCTAALLFFAAAALPLLLRLLVLQLLLLLWRWRPWRAARRV